MASPEIEALTNALARLPGLGPRSARRAVLHLLKRRETTLAPQLGVGRSTVREAIRQLAGRGILATRQGAGVFVVALDAPEDWTRTVARADILAVITFGIGGILFLVIWVVALVFMIMAAVAANKGEVYKVPMSIQFIK